MLMDAYKPRERNRVHRNQNSTRVWSAGESCAADSQGFKGQLESQLHGDDGQDVRHAELPHSDSLAQHNAAVDRIFAGEAGPLAEGVLPRRFS